MESWGYFLRLGLRLFPDGGGVRSGTRPLPSVAFQVSSPPVPSRSTSRALPLSFWKPKGKCRARRAKHQASAYLDRLSPPASRLGTSPGLGEVRMAGCPTTVSPYLRSVSLFFGLFCREFLA